MREKLLKFLKKEMNKQGIVRLSLRDIAFEIGTSHNNVKVILGELEALGKIEIEKKTKRKNIIKVKI